MTLDTERWGRMKAIFHEVADLPEAQRLEVIDARGVDTEMRRELDELLLADARASRFIAGSAGSPVAPQTLPDSIGSYRIVSEVSQGGMGTVYLAEREGEVRQRVAVKVIRGGMNTDHVVGRFRQERQILANLDHPNIARFLDGGTTRDGLPYFVMEFVDGVPIDQYCSQRRLSTTERLRLFLSVCAAVQYAHQNLVVHRDIKPTNVLVTQEGIPKLLDFGIAKIVADSGPADQTATELRAMTPEYASPEQVLGHPLTTASDVYSLGVVLYELLTEERPYRFNSRSPGEIARVISEKEATRPSSVAGELDVSRRRSLRGDLDNIVLMALRKDARRRYASAESLANDIRRHLEGLPVVARRDTFGYRAAKLVRRNKLPVTILAALVLALAGGIVATQHQAAVARAERDRAQQRFNDVRRLARTMIFEIDDEIANISGATKAREKLVSRALEYLELLSREASGPDLQLELAIGYQKIGEVQGNPFHPNLGQYEASLKSYEKSRVILETLIREPGGDKAAALPAMARGYRGLGDLRFQLNQLQRAHDLYVQAIGALESLARLRPLQPDEERSAAWSISRYADILGNPRYANLGRFDEALAQHRRALRLREQLFAKTRNDEDFRAIFDSHAKLSAIESGVGQYARAAESASRAIEIIEQIAAGRPDASVPQNELSFSYYVAAQPLRDLGRYEEAVRMLEKSVSVMERLAEKDASSAAYRRSLSVLFHHLMSARLEMRDFRGANVAAQRTVSLAEALWLEQPASEAAMDYVISLNRAADAAFSSGDHRAAVAQSRRALSMLDQISSQDDRRIEHERALAETRIGRVQMAAASLDEAISRLEPARQRLERLRENNRQDVRLADDLATTTFHLGIALTTRDLNRACATLASSVGLWRELRTAGTINFAAAQKLALAQERAARCTAAR